MMRSHISKNCRQRTHSQRVIQRNGQVMFTVSEAGQPDVTANLPCCLIPQTIQSLDELRAG